MKELILQAQQNYLLATVLTLAALMSLRIVWKVGKFLIKLVITDMNNWFFGKMMENTPKIFKYTIIRESVMKDLEIDNINNLKKEVKQLRDLFGQFTVTTVAYDKSKVDLKERFPSLKVGEALIEELFCNNWYWPGVSEQLPDRNGKRGCGHRDEYFQYEHDEFVILVDFIQNEIKFNLKSMNAYRGFKRMTSKL